MRRFTISTFHEMPFKSKWMIWTKHTTGMTNMASEYKSLSANLKKRGHLVHSDVDGSIILNWISKT